MKYLLVCLSFLSLNIPSLSAQTHVDMEVLCVGQMNQDGVPGFLYPYCDTLWFSAHIDNAGNAEGIVSTVDFEVHLQNIDVVTGEFYDSLLAYSETVSYGGTVSPSETLVLWTQDGIHPEPGVYRINASVDAPEDTLLANNEGQSELRVYNAIEEYWMSYTDEAPDELMTTDEGRIWATRFEAMVFPLDLDTAALFLGQEGDTGTADVSVYTIDPSTGLPDSEVFHWFHDEVLGGEWSYFFNEDSLGDTLPIAIFDSLGFFIAYTYHAPLGLWIDRSEPIAAKSNCIHFVSYTHDGNDWAEDTLGDGFVWASTSPGIAPYLCGDTNEDGRVTTGDGFNLLGYFCSVGCICDKRTADVNGNCKWTTGDAFHLLNYFGDSASFPMNCDGCWPGCTNCE